MGDSPDYDVALSFAGEDREYVESVANLLRQKHVKVFYDKFEQEKLWGKDLYTHLSDIYHKRAQFTVMFISKHYSEKLWTNHEREAAQTRAFHESREYILPARFDNTEIPGVLATTGYISLDGLSPENFVEIIIKKLVNTGESVPTELARKNHSTVTRRPTSDSTELNVYVKDNENQSIVDCSLAMQAENGVTISGITDANGNAKLKFPTRRLYTLLLAHNELPSSIVYRLDPIESISIELQRITKIGSIIMHSTGYIPGLTGRLNPILDASNRMYLYADNIAINGGEPQPTSFAIDQPTTLEDANGVIVYATVKHIAARTSLIEFTRLT